MVISSGEGKNEHEHNIVGDNTKVNETGVFIPDEAAGEYNLAIKYKFESKVRGEYAIRSKMKKICIVEDLDEHKAFEIQKGNVYSIFRALT